MTRFAVKESFLTLQGEGAHAGRAAVFLRFAGCNLWSGREADRAKGPGACAAYCDTEFVGTDGDGGGWFEDEDELANQAERLWPGNRAKRFVVLTGGEPSLQVTRALVLALRERWFDVAMETNGTRRVDDLRLDWVCVSPKVGAADLAQKTGDELKVLYPMVAGSPLDYEHFQFDRLSVQPIDDANREANTRAAVQFCLAHPRWRLSLQTHKLLGIR